MCSILNLKGQYTKHGIGWGVKCIKPFFFFLFIYATLPINLQWFFPQEPANQSNQSLLCFLN